MKYSSTPRLINTLVFAVLAAGFGFLAVYFGFLVAPYLWKEIGVTAIEIPVISYGLAAMLSSVGFAGLILSIIGLVNSILSFMKRDDKYVLNGFNCYFALGYVLAVALILNASWLLPLTTSNFSGDVSMPFVAIVYVIGAVLVMVGTNIPLVKLYENDESGKTMGKILLLASIVIGVSIFITFAISLLFVLIYGAGKVGQINLIVKFLVYGLIPLLGACVAFFGLRASRKDDESKLPATLLYASLGIQSLGILAAGIFMCAYNTDEKLSLVSQTKNGSFGALDNWAGYAGLSFAVGGVILLGAIALIVITYLPKKEKKESVY